VTEPRGDGQAGRPDEARGPAGAPASRRTPTVIVVGAAARDLVSDDPRGWRLGGGASYSALTTARLGLPTGAIIGVDDAAATAPEIDLLREAGVDVRLVPLERGPVFVNIERPDGRHQLCEERSDQLPVDAVPDAWLDVQGWILAPVAAELPTAWADVPPDDAFVGLGWQGLLRELVPGEPTRHVPPHEDLIVHRANLVGLSRDDVGRDTDLADLYALLHRGASLAVTHGDQGGLIVHGRRSASDAALEIRHYPPIRSEHPVDPTGAGDVFLAALAAARIEPRLVGGRTAKGFDLLLAAAAASLVLEGPGMLGVPMRDAVRTRMAKAMRPTEAAG
jgi:sugar/nucleoside kinase (ribokinase family)